MKKLIFYFVILLFSFSCKNAVDLRNQAISFEEKGNYTMAIKYLDKAIAKNPKYIDAYIDRGVDYSILGKYSDAIENYTEVIKLDTLNVLAYYNRSKNFNRLKKHQEAYFDINRAYQITTKYRLGNMYVVMENDNYAVALADIILEQGVTFFHMDSISQAISALTYSIEHNVHEAFYWRGLSYFKSEEKEKGCNDLENALANGQMDAKDAFELYCK